MQNIHKKEVQQHNHTHIDEIIDNKNCSQQFLRLLQQLYNTFILCRLTLGHIIEILPCQRKESNLRARRECRTQQQQHGNTCRNHSTHRRHCQIDICSRWCHNLQQSSQKYIQNPKIKLETISLDRTFLNRSRAGSP